MSSDTDLAKSHTGNGLDLTRTHKSCRPLVKKLQEAPPNGPEKVWVRTTDKATTTPVKGEIEGEIPAWLEGSLYRNGPGVLNIGDTWYNHVFDGMAVLHKFTIKNGEATYSSRILESDSFVKNTEANRIVVNEFGTKAYPDPCKTILQKFASRFKGPDFENSTDNCCVNFCFFGDQLFTMTEANFIRRIDPETMRTIGGKTNLTNYVAVNFATAHPHVDANGTVYNMGNSFSGSKGPSYNVIKFPPDQTQPDGKILTSMEQASIVASIPCRWKTKPCYYHSFSLTDNYYILTEQPLGVSLGSIVTTLIKGQAMVKALKWMDDETTRFRVVRRSDGHVLKTCYEAPTFFTFHTINAYEENGQIVLDTCCYDDGAVVNQLWLENILKPTEAYNKALEATPRRFVLPLDVENAPLDTNLVRVPGSKCKSTKNKKGIIHCESEDLAACVLDMPRINYKFNGKKYRYCYGFSPKGLNCGTLTKVDTVTKTHLQWNLTGFQASEPVFVERPGATEEDDGVILSALLNNKNEKEARMVVLDAKTMKPLAMTSFKTHGTVTRDFHGLFAREGDKVHGY